MKLRDLARSIGDKIMPHTKQAASCPSVTGWPEDDVSKWVASHRKETKDIICRSSQGKNVAFCGTTRSDTASAEAKSTANKSGDVKPVEGRKTRVDTKKVTRAKTARKAV